METWTTRVGDGGQDVHLGEIGRRRIGRRQKLREESRAARCPVSRPRLGHHVADLPQVQFSLRRHVPCTRRYAFTYAGNNKGASVAAGSYYEANKNPYAAYVSAAAELYAATKEATFSSAATSASSSLTKHGYTFCYQNPDDIGYYEMGTAIGTSSWLTSLKTTYVASYNSAGTGKGPFHDRQLMGIPAISGNQAFIAALYDKAAGVTTYDSFIYHQVDYILGANNAKQSFVVGFCSGCTASPQHPHHRNLYLNDTNPSDADKQRLPIPTHNAQLGYLVGGTSTSSAYSGVEIPPASNTPKAASTTTRALSAPWPTSSPSFRQWIPLSSGQVPSPPPPLLRLPFLAHQRSHRGAHLWLRSPGSRGHRPAWTGSGAVRRLGHQRELDRPNAGLYLIRSRTANGWASAKALLQ